MKSGTAMRLTILRNQSKPYLLVAGVMGVIAILLWALSKVAT
jgi:hypothetical protein